MTCAANLQCLVIFADGLIDGIQFIGIGLQLRDKISRNIVLSLHIVTDDPFT